MECLLGKSIVLVRIPDVGAVDMVSWLLLELEGICMG
jgi:hypothetical protein